MCVYIYIYIYIYIYMRHVMSADHMYMFHYFMCTCFIIATYHVSWWFSSVYSNICSVIVTFCVSPRPQINIMVCFAWGVALCAGKNQGRQIEDCPRGPPSASFGGSQTRLEKRRAPMGRFNWPNSYHHQNCSINQPMPVKQTYRRTWILPGVPPPRHACSLVHASFHLTYRHRLNGYFA